MAVTDLTGYTWVGVNGAFASEPTFNKSLNFNCNNVSYQKIILSGGTLYYQPTGTSGYTSVHTGSGWADQVYRTIEITGGTNATDTALIAWLEANGTLTPSVVTSGKMYLGTSSISKMYIGQTEVQKIYLGDKLVYEKATPSGYTVSGTNDVGTSMTYITLYSTDDGATWNEIPNGSFTLPAMTTFKLKLTPGADYLMSASSTQLGLNLPLQEGTWRTSSNYTLTQNITDLTIHGEWD